MLGFNAIQTNDETWNISGFDSFTSLSFSQTIVVMLKNIPLISIIPLVFSASICPHN